MKKTIYAFAFSVLMAGTILTSCDSKEKNVEDAKEEVGEAKEDLKDAQHELNAEYPAYRTDMEARIEANDKRISELKAKLNEPGKKPLDEMRKQRIEDLEKRNADLRAKLVAYETNHSDWEEFKREFNHDMDELGKSFDDLGKDNAK